MLSLFLSEKEHFKKISESFIKIEKKVGASAKLGSGFFDSEM